MIPIASAVKAFTVGDDDAGFSLDQFANSDQPLADDVSIDAAIRDVEAIIGEPLRKKRGRKAKAGTETESKKLEVPGFDAAKFEDTLAVIYWNTISLLMRFPLNPTDEQINTTKPLISHCANQYIPAGASEHIPLAALLLTTWEIIQSSKRVADKESEGNKK